jgi:hypothetical protein
MREFTPSDAADAADDAQARRWWKRPATNEFADPIPLKPLSPADRRLSATPPSARYFAFPTEAISAASTIGGLGQTLARTVDRVATIHSPVEAKRIIARLEEQIAALKGVL